MKLLDSYFATTKKDVKLVNISPKKNKVLYILKKKNDVKLSDISPAKTVWYYQMFWLNTKKQEKKRCQIIGYFAYI